MAPIADASLTSIRDAVETTYGIAPGGTYVERRMVNESLGQDKEAVQSDEIVPDRRSSDNIQVNSSASGDVVSELTGGSGANDTWGLWWRAALGATSFTVPVGNVPGSLFTAGTITPTNEADPDDIKLTIGSGTPANWPSFVAGEFITFAGFTGVRAVFNTIYKVKSGGGTTALVVTAGPRVPASPGTEPAVNVGGITLPSITDASQFRSFSIERAYSITNEFALTSGMVLTGFDVEIAPKRPMRVTWHWIGEQEISTTATNSSSVTPAVTSRRSFSPVSDFRTIALDEDGHSYFLNDFKLSFKNGAYLQDERAGNLGAVGVGLGTFEATGSYGFYYEAGTVHDQFQKFTDKELIVSVQNSVGDSVVFHLPRINWVAGRRSTAGKDQAIKGTVDFRAAKGPAFFIKIARV